jgi:hypothetical protein
MLLMLLQRLLALSRCSRERLSACRSICLRTSSRHL